MYGYGDVPYADIKKQNVAIEVLRKLLKDQLRSRVQYNKVRYSSLLEMLEDLIERYENNVINSSQVMEKLLELAEEVKTTEQESESLGLSKEELAFYDALRENENAARGDQEIKEIVQELVKKIRRDIAVDWTNNEQIKARVKAHVRRLLLQKGYSQGRANQLRDVIFDQAVALYKDYVPE